MDDNLQKAIEEIKQLREWLAKGRAREMELRKQIAEQCFKSKQNETGNGFLPGTHVYRDGALTLRLAQGTDYKVKGTPDEVMAACANAGIGPTDAMRIKFEVAVREYGHLTEAQQLALSAVVETKPKTIELTFE